VSQKTAPTLKWCSSKLCHQNRSL